MKREKGKFTKKGISGQDKRCVGKMWGQAPHKKIIKGEELMESCLSAQKRYLKTKGE